MSTKTVPRKACTFRADVSIDVDRNEGAQTAPFEMLARSGDPIDHHYWGQVVHDMEGMESKNRVPIDYNHTDDIVGYANRFNTEDGDLKLKGALTPYRESDRATEIIYKAKLGVPWEASIFFDGVSIEKVPEGEEVDVNNRQLTGPLTIFRKWTLRGVAITPYGYDHRTQTQLSAGDEIEIEIIEEPNMADENTTPEVDETVTAEAEVDEAVDTETDSDSSEESNELESAPATEESVDEQPAEAVALTAPGQAYMDAFGDEAGALYFAKGVPFEEAMTQELQRLRKENQELTQRASAASTDGVEEPMAFSQSEGKTLLTKIPARIIE